MDNTDPKQKAESLANSFGRSLGAENRTFDRQNFISYGETSFRFDPARSILISYVLVTPIDDENDGTTPQEIKCRSEFVRLLNDPEIGGMYENGGSVWILDGTLKGIFITYEFPVATTTPRQLLKKMNDLVSISGPWVVDWWQEVAEIRAGERPKPTRRITRADRP